MFSKSMGDQPVGFFDFFIKQVTFLGKPKEIVDFSQIPWESNRLGWYDNNNNWSGGQRGVKVMSSSIASVGTQG